jgi:hypothetical protein
MSIENTKTKACDVLKEIMGKGIDWYDYHKLTPAEKKNYYTEAQRLLRSHVLINEVNAYLTDLVKEISYNSKDFNEVVALRYSANGVKVLLERLESIENPEGNVSNENPNSAI